MEKESKIDREARRGGSPRTAGAGWVLQNVERITERTKKARKKAPNKENAQNRETWGKRFDERGND